CSAPRPWNLWMYDAGCTNHLLYLLPWAGSLIAWGWTFSTMRRHMGPVTFIERQIAHVYAAGIVGCISIFAAEWVQDRPVLSMAQGLAVVGSLVFLVKAAILSGRLYIASAALLITSRLMASFACIQLLLFAPVSAA